MAIEVHNVSKRFGTFQALDDVSFSVAAGELVALLGPSGSGKTTLLRVIAGLEAAERGTVMLEGEDATDRNAMAGELLRWPMPAADPTYYLSTGQVWDNFPADAQRYPRLENALRELFYIDHGWFFLRDAGEHKAYGWKHYGDWACVTHAPIRNAAEADDPGRYYMNNEYSNKQCIHPSVQTL